MCANIKTKVYFQTAAFTLHNDTMQCILSVYCRLLLIFIHSLHIEPYTLYIEAFDHTDTNDRSDKSWLGWRQTATGEKTIWLACITPVPSCTTLLIHMGRIVPSCTACSTIVNTHVPFCTRQVPHYITLSLQRHGNTAVESVVSPSQIICRGGHTHLGYLTAKS